MSWKQKKTRWVKNTENLQVENKKVEGIYIREFTFCAKREAVHSSTEKSEGILRPEKNLT